MAVSDKPWGSFAVSDYSPSQWRRACLVDTGVGDQDAKDRYKVAVREPDGSLNRNAVHAAASSHGVGSVRGISSDMRQSVARKIVGLYRNDLVEEPPDMLMMMAGMRQADPTASVALEPHFRAFRPDLDIKRDAGADGRTVYGIAVPWDAPTRIDDDLVESFASGAFDHQLRAPTRVKFAREHVRLGGALIGSATVLRNDGAGLYGEWRVARTAAGDETLELMRDGALDQLSIMFRERQNRRLAGGITERVSADLIEVAVVMEGAYGELAAAAGVRSKGEPLAAEEVDLRGRAERFLYGGLPELTDHDLTARAIRLGLPI